MADNSLDYSRSIADKKINPPNPVTWEKQSNANYNYAASFYRQRKMAFLTYINKNIIARGAEIISDDLSTIFEKVWTDGVLQALQLGISNPSEGQKLIDSLNETYDLNLNFNHLLTTYKNNKTNLGYDYEDVVASLLSKYFKSLQTKANQFTEQNIDSLLDFKQITGKGAYSRAAHVKGAPLIRMDVGNMELEQRNKISYIKNAYYNGQQLTSELQHFIDIDIDPLKPSENMPKELLPYLANGRFAGFSVKQMETLINEKFSQSSIIANKINAGLAASTSSGKRRRWENDWAEAYSNWCLSKSLFNILGPVDIGIVTGKNFYWIDDFLSSARFRMRTVEDLSVPNSVDLNNPNFAYRKTYESTYTYISKRTGKERIRKDDKGKIMITEIN